MSQHTLARAYDAAGQVQKAVALLEHVVVVCEKVLAEEHLSRLESHRALTPLRVELKDRLEEDL